MCSICGLVVLFVCYFGLREMVKRPRAKKIKTKKTRGRIIVIIIQKVGEELGHISPPVIFFSSSFKMLFIRFSYNPGRFP